MLVNVATPKLKYPGSPLPLTPKGHCHNISLLVLITTVRFSYGDRAPVIWPPFHLWLIPRLLYN